MLSGVDSGENARRQQAAAFRRPCRRSITSPRRQADFFPRVPENAVFRPQVAASFAERESLRHTRPSIGCKARLSVGVQQDPGCGGRLVGGPGIQGAARTRSGTSYEQRRRRRRRTEARLLEHSRDLHLERYGGRLLGGAPSDADDDDDDAPAPGSGADSQGLSRALVQNCLLVGLSASLQGWDHGAASGALHNLESLKGLAHQADFGALMEGWIIASAWLSTIVGNLGGLRVPTPKLALILAAVLETGGSLLTALAPSLPWLIAGRLLNGLGLGLTGVAVGQYTSEVAPPQVRGGAIACQETNFVLGALLGSLAGRHWLRKPGGWRKIWGVAAIPGVLALVAILRMPDTPRSIYKQAVAAAGRQPFDTAEAAQQRVHFILEAARRDALASMCALRGLREPDAALLVEIEEIEQTYASELGLRGRAMAPSGSNFPAGQEIVVSDLREEWWWQEELSLADIFGSEVRRRLLFTGCLANLFPALSGQEALLNYATQTFSAVGFGVRDGASLSAALFSLKLVATLPDFLWLDEYGRRTLFSAGLVGITISYTVALAGVATGGHYLAGVALAASAVAYQVAVGPVSWIVSAELYPSDMRNRGCALAAVTYSLSTMLSVQFHPLLMRRGPLAFLATYACSCTAAWFLSQAFIPETKGRSLEQIQGDAFSGRLFSQSSATRNHTVGGVETPRIHADRAG